MAQTTYEEYLANLMGNINPQGGMVTGQMPQATPTTPPPQMAMPDLSAIQQAMQGVRDVNQGYVAPQMTDLNKFRSDFESQRQQAASDFIANQLGVPTGMLSYDSAGGDGRNYYVEREAQLRAANLPEDEVQAIVRAEQVANNQKFNDTLTSLSKMGIGGIISSLFGGSTASLPAEVKAALDAKAAAEAAASQPVSSGGGGDYSSYEGAGMAQTQASLQSDNTGGFYG